ncbi:MAG: dipeptidase [Synergistaceae bacterium]|nr:dipeptidase [Synergistaceae bacterium]
MKKLYFLTLCLLFTMLAAPAFSCTTIIAGKDATTDGSVMVSHSDDGLSDASLVYIPAMDHAPGSLRPVFYSHESIGFKPEWGGTQTHRIITKGRGSVYDKKGLPSSIPLGFIPQVAHTYAYFDANYGIMNEHQLTIGECTDKAKVHPEPETGKRIFYSSELSRVALERTKTAREAVMLMGEMIEKYGYYGTGETLLVGDPNEGWVMEMAGYDMNGPGGVWVAQRVPDDKIFVAANQFRIREINTKSKDMIFSKNIFEIAEQKGWWKPSEGPLDFTKVYGDGEFHHPYYSLRRVWRAMSLLAPSMNFSPWVKDELTKDYPFAVKPDKKISVADLASIHRDNYEGTEFDMTKGLAAGPFGNPTRYEGNAESVADTEGKLTLLVGEFERPLDIYRCVYSFVAQSRNWLPDEVGGLLWYGPDRPSTNILLPFYSGMTDLPKQIQQANILDLNRESVWSSFNFVANLATIKWSYMIKDIREERTKLERRVFDLQSLLEANAFMLIKGGKKEEARKMLTDYSVKNTLEVLDAWHKLAERLYVKYNDGYLNTAEQIGQPLFYPSWWLKEVGYEKGPVSYQKKK